MFDKLKVKGFRYKLVLVLLAFNLSFLCVHAQENSTDFQVKSVYVTLYTGISVPIQGERYYNDGWEPEYLVGGNVFYHINNYLLAGVRINYNHWLSSESKLTQSYPSTTDWTEISGHASVIEIVPSFRIILSDNYNKSNLFLQLGGGYFYMEGTYYISGTYQDINTALPPVGYSDSKTFNFNEGGLNLGLGIKAGKVEIFPLLSVMFTPIDPTYFVTLNVGYNF